MTLETIAMAVEKPDSEGFWWGKNISSLWGMTWMIYRIRKPFWVDPNRHDLNWFYLDGSGGSDFPPGGSWVKCEAPTS